MEETKDPDELESINDLNCLFCQICKGVKPCSKQFEDETYFAFNDCKPAATHHYLIIPKIHYKNILSLQKQNAKVDMVEIGKTLLRNKGIDEARSRMGFHWPPFHAISHLHLHVIAPENEMGCISRIIFRRNSYWFVSPEVALATLQDEE